MTEISIDTQIEDSLENVEVLARATRTTDGRQVTVAVDQASLSSTLSVVSGDEIQDATLGGVPVFEGGTWAPQRIWGIDVRRYVSAENGNIRTFDLATAMTDVASSGLPLMLPMDGKAYQPAAAPVLLNDSNARTRYMIAGGGRLYMPSGMSSGDALLHRNRLADGTGVENAYGEHPRVVVQDIRIEGPDGCEGTFLDSYKSSVSFERVRFTNILKLALLDGYSDMCRFVSLYGEAMTSEDEFAIECVYPGDGWVLENLHFYGIAGLSLKKQNGFALHGMIGGWHEFTECDGEMGGLHIEGDTAPAGAIHDHPLITCKGSRLDIRSGVLYTNVARTAAVVVDDNSGTSERHSSVTFGPELHFAQRLDAPGSTVGNLLGTAVYIQNPSKRTHVLFEGGGTQRLFRQDSTGADGGYTYCAPKVATPNVSTDEQGIQTAIAARPALLATHVEIRKRNDTWEIAAPDPLGSFRTSRRVTATGSNGAGSISFSPSNADPTPVDGATWTQLVDGTTYYYKAWTRDLEAGTTISVEPSGVSKTSGNTIKLAGNAFNGPVTLRILRGTSAGTFTHWAEIYLKQGEFNLWDQGNAIAGVAWSTSGLPGAPSTNTTYDGVVVRGTGKQQIYASAAPSSSDRAWSQGDICWNTGAAANDKPGWICTTGGSPGTWKAMANVAS